MTYFEAKSFTNSTQKTDGVVYGVGADIHYNHSAYKFIYEKGDTNTIQPPLPSDLKTDKLFLKYSYELNEKFSFNLNYINVLNDNIAITDGGQTYGAGLSYSFNKATLSFTNFHTIFDDFSVNQTDVNVEYKTKVKNIKLKLNLITKYILIDDDGIDYAKTKNFTKNAQDNYLTTGLKLHLHSHGYHFGSAIYLGKRAFAIMDNGLKIQHHAMEFDRTFAIGIGKNISQFVVRLQYIYARATELPNLNKDVKVSTTRFVANYKF
jgi:hypothetical protein